MSIFGCLIYAILPQNHMFMYITSIYEYDGWCQRTSCDILRYMSPIVIL